MFTLKARVFKNKYLFLLIKRTSFQRKRHLRISIALTIGVVTPYRYPVRLAKKLRHLFFRGVNWGQCYKHFCRNYGDLVVATAKLLRQKLCFEKFAVNTVILP